MYHVQHFAYCGMPSLRETFDDVADARAEAAARLRRYRQRYRVVTLARGAEWEILEPEDAVLVPDACGTLTLRRETFKCHECGSEHDTRDDAAWCCTYGEDSDEETLED